MKPWLPIICLAVLCLTGCAERAKAKHSMPLPPDAVDAKNDCVRDVQCLPNGWKYSDAKQGLYCPAPSRMVAKLVCRGAK